MSKKVFSTLGASNHSKESRQVDDYYATDPIAVKLLLEVESFQPYIWECACGEGHISKELEKNGYDVRSTDLIDRGYGEGNIDFLKTNEIFKGDIITNPPYKHAQDFVEKAINTVNGENAKVAMFLRVLFLEGKKRKKLFEKYPPKVLYVSSSRINCAKNGKFKSGQSSAVAYGWFVWEKGFKGDTVVKWIN